MKVIDLTPDWRVSHRYLWLRLTIAGASVATGCGLWIAGVGGEYSPLLGFAGLLVAIDWIHPNKFNRPGYKEDAFPTVESSLYSLDNRFVLVKDWKPFSDSDPIPYVVFGPSGVAIIAFDGPDGEDEVSENLSEYIEAARYATGRPVDSFHVVSDHQLDSAPIGAFALSTLKGRLERQSGELDGRQLWSEVWSQRRQLAGVNE